LLAFSFHGPSDCFRARLVFLKAIVSLGEESIITAVPVGAVVLVGGVATILAALTSRPGIPPVLIVLLYCCGEAVGVNHESFSVVDETEFFELCHEIGDA
jgi:hypothetical protein